MSESLEKLIETHPRIASSWSEADWAILAAYFPAILKSHLAPGELVSHVYISQPNSSQPNSSQPSREEFPSVLAPKRLARRALEAIAAEGDPKELRKFLDYTKISRRGLVEVLPTPILAAVESASYKFLREVSRMKILQEVFSANPAMPVSLLVHLDIDGAPKESREMARIILRALPADPKMRVRAAIACISMRDPEITRTCTSLISIDWEDIINIVDNREIILGILAGPLQDQAYQHVFIRYESTRELLEEILPELVKHVAPKDPQLYRLAGKSKELLAWLYANDCPITQGILADPDIKGMLREIMFS